MGIPFMLEFMGKMTSRIYMELHMCMLVAGRKALLYKLPFPNDSFLLSLLYLLAYCSTEEERRRRRKWGWW